MGSRNGCVRGPLRPRIAVWCSRRGSRCPGLPLLSCLCPVGLFRCKCRSGSARKGDVEGKWEAAVGPSAVSSSVPLPCSFSQAHPCPTFLSVLHASPDPAGSTSAGLHTCHRHSGLEAGGLPESGVATWARGSASPSRHRRPRQLRVAPSALQAVWSPAPRELPVSLGNGVPGRRPHRHRGVRPEPRARATRS